MRAWRESRDASSTPGAKGIDGLTARQFSENRDHHFSRIIEDIKRGAYRFADLRPFFVPKKSGKLRVICVPTVADRLVQRVIIDQLTRNDRFRLVNPVSFGFVRGKGVQAAIKEAIKRRADREWALKTDIQSFFDRIDRAKLKELIKRRLRNHSLVPLLCDAVDCEVRAKTQLDRRRLQELGIHGGRGLRQGMPPFSLALQSRAR
jgi:retron-type reverse transcriptase